MYLKNVRRSGVTRVGIKSIARPEGVTRVLQDKKNITRAGMYYNIRKYDVTKIEKSYGTRKGLQGPEISRI